MTRILSVLVLSTMMVPSYASAQDVDDDSGSLGQRFQRTVMIETVPPAPIGPTVAPDIVPEPVAPAVAAGVDVGLTEAECLDEEEFSVCRQRVIDALDDCEDDLSVVDAEVATVEGGEGLTPDIVADLMGRHAWSGGRILGIEARLDDLEAARPSEDTEGLREQIEELRSGLETRVSGLEDRVRTIEVWKATVSQTIRANTAGLAANVTTLEGLETRLSAQEEEEVSTVIEVIDRFRGGVHGQVTVDQGVPVEGIRSASEAFVGGGGHLGYNLAKQFAVDVAFSYGRGKATSKWQGDLRGLGRFSVQDLDLELGLLLGTSQTLYGNGDDGRAGLAADFSQTIRLGLHGNVRFGPGCVSVSLATVGGTFNNYELDATPTARSVVFTIGGGLAF